MRNPDDLQEPEDLELNPRLMDFVSIIKRIPLRPYGDSYYGLSDELHLDHVVFAAKAWRQTLKPEGIPRFEWRDPVRPSEATYIIFGWQCTLCQCIFFGRQIKDLYHACTGHYVFNEGDSVRLLWSPRDETSPWAGKTGFIREIDDHGLFHVYLNEVGNLWADADMLEPFNP